MSSIDWDSIEAGVQAWVMAGSGLDDAHVIWAFDGGGRPSSPFIEMSYPQIDQIGHDYVRKENNPLVFADVVVVPDHATGELAGVGHGFQSGDGPVRLPTDGVLPTGLHLDTDYWIVRVDADHVKLADSFVHTGGNYPGNPITTVAFSDDGAGTMKITATADAVRAGAEIRQRAQGQRNVTFQLQCFGGPRTRMLAMRIMHEVIAALPLHVDDLNAAGLGLTSVGATDIAGGIKLVPDRIDGQIEPTSVVVFTGYVGSEFVGLQGRVDSIEINPTVTFEDGTSIGLPQIEIDS